MWSEKLEFNFCNRARSTTNIEKMIAETIKRQQRKLKVGSISTQPQERMILKFLYDDVAVAHTKYFGFAFHSMFSASLNGKLSPEYLCYVDL